jgi:hypothetical protein
MMNARALGALGSLLALSVATALAAPLAAQQAGGRGGFQIGYQAPDIDPLNTSLVAGGFPAFEDGFLTFGGFGFGRVGNFLVGGEGHGFLPREATTADGSIRTRLGGGYGMFNLGYMAFSDARVDIYPIFGIGGGQLQLDLIERSSPVFDDVLDDPGTSTRLTTDDFLLSAAGGADYRFGVPSRDARRRRDRDDDEGRGGLFLGVRAGWTWAPGDARWELDELNEVAGGPAVGPTGFFVRMSIGGWGGG